MKVVIDTNILVSGLINVQGAPGRIVDLIRTGRLRPVVDDRILSEYGDVLFRERLRYWVAIADARNIMSFLSTYAERVTSNIVIKGLPDPGDSAFLEVAITAGIPLITGNMQHFPTSLCRGCRIVRPSAFLDHQDF